MTPDLLSPNQHTILETAVHPRNHLAFLSQAEIDRLIDRNANGLYPLIRSCALAILNSGVNTDDSVGLFAQHQHFDLTFADILGGSGSPYITRPSRPSSMVS